MSSLQEQQGPIDRLIVNELIMATPSWWNSAILEIERLDEPEGIEKFRQVISSPENHRDVVFVTTELNEAVICLADVFRRFGKVWSKAIYRVELQPDDSWKYNVRFKY